MKILFLGDIVAKSGREAVVRMLPDLKIRYGADFTIVNGENAAHGKGITVKIYRALKAAGADVITLGNHAFSKREIIEKLPECPDLVRPANMEPQDAGQTFVIRTCGKHRIAVINVVGEMLMDGSTESPFTAADKLLQQIDADIIFCDLHAETTSEKEIFLRLFADRMTAVIGTHTHVQTADEKIYRGCAFMTDAGMCGAADSILGRDAEEVIARTVRGEKTHYTPAEGDAMICGCLITVDDETRRAVGIERIRLTAGD